MAVDALERSLYNLICSHDGIKAKELGRLTGRERGEINRCLYHGAFLKDLCCRDENFLWHGLIRQARPHRGLEEFSGYYGRVRDFLTLSEEEFLSELQKGCKNNGRNLNDTRGLFHSFRDTRETMLALFSDLPDVDFADWELVFELRIRRSRHIRIYADVLLITEAKVFSLEFKMKDTILPEEVVQAGKYAEYLELIFGPGYDVIPALVLTRAQEHYGYTELPGTDGVLPVCSGDMLFNLLDEYLGFLEQ